MITATALFLIITAISVGISLLVLFKSRSDSSKVKDVSDEEKNKLLSIISSLNDGVIVLDDKLNPWAINDSARSFLGITKESPTFEDISLSFASEMNIQEKIKEVMQFDRVTTLHEVIITGKTFQVFINPIGGKNNVPISGVSVLLQDITAEKSVEKTKEEFSHSVVHELRAPVTAIKDSASLMIADGLSEEDEKKMLNLIHDQAKKMLTQISTILDAAKVEGGKLILTKAPGDIGKVVQDEVALFLPEAKKKNITLVAEVGNNLPVVSFDSIRIAQAITNIISNSLKYTNENGIIKITVDTDEEYERTKSEGFLIITVADNGIGILPEKQNMLFTKFGQFNSNASKESQKASSGLGLYITKGIIDAHGGTIGIESAVGKGTTTTLKLPINS